MPQVPRWSTLPNLGGSDNEDAGAVRVDSSGNVYVTGSTRSSNFPTVNAFQPLRSGDFDSYVVKLNADGSALIYSTYVGGSSAAPGTNTADDHAWDITVHNSALRASHQR